MRGTKRQAVSDSTPDNNNNSFFQFQSKKPIPHNDFNSKATGTPSLDMRRAELSRQHVRALNNQFASWVQTQLQNHPDELWEDGLRDYLSHASNIMEKFSDVVKWLKLNSTKSENLLDHVAQKKPVTESKDITNVPVQEKTTTAPPAAKAPLFATSSFPNSWSTGPIFNAQKNPVTESKDITNVPVQEKSTPAPPSATAPMFATSSFTNSWSTGPIFNAQPSSNTQSSFNPPSSSIFAGKGVFSLKPDASNDADDDDEIERPSSPSVKKIEETGISVVHEVKCKLYVKSTDPADKDSWKDRGTGQLSIKCKEGVTKGTKDSKPTVLVRNDVGRLLLNALLYPGIKTSLQKNSIVAIFHTADDNGSETSKVIARTYLIRTKNEEDRDKLAAAIKEYAPAA